MMNVTNIFAIVAITGYIQYAKNIKWMGISALYANIKNNPKNEELLDYQNLIALFV